MNPTLSLAKAIASQNLPVEQLEEIQEQFVTVFFHPDAKLTDMVFTAEGIEHIATGTILTDFTAHITGRYKVNGTPVLVLSTGDVVELRFI
jgi:hypothetical protein